VITVTLPWPDPDLSPNGRKRWAKIKAVTHANKLAYVLTMDSLHWISQTPIPAGVIVEVTFHKPTRRRMDIDNLVGRCKPYQDGIFQALGWDDALICEARYVMGQIIPDGLVIITIKTTNETVTSC